MVLERGHKRLPEYKISDIRDNIYQDTTETISDISTEEIGKLGLPVLGASLICFQKRSTLDSSP